MPKLVRSASEPCVNISHSHIDELDFYNNAPPKTPVHPSLNTFIDAFTNQSTTLKVSWSHDRSHDTLLLLVCCVTLGRQEAVDYIHVVLQQNHFFINLSIFVFDLYFASIKGNVWHRFFFFCTVSWCQKAH